MNAQVANSHRHRWGIPEWLFDYRKGWFRYDLLAGLVAAAVVIPKAMAYATVAGLPVQVGLYTVLIPMAVYALLGSSRPLSMSTTTTIAILLAAETLQFANRGDTAALVRITATLSLLVGAILVLASLLRLGFFANFVSEPVLVGFKTGIALVIILDQIPKLIGIHITRTGFLRDIFAIAQNLPEASLATVGVGLFMIALLVVLEHFLPHAPAPLIAVAAGIAGMRFLNLQAYGVAPVGNIPEGLPSATMPDVSLVLSLWPAAAGIALMSFTESIAAARAFARSDEPPIRPNRELLATGLANAAGAFCGAMPAGGGATQTAINRRAGARTQVAELVTVAGALVTMLLLSRPMGLMPQAVLAAVVIVYSMPLIQPAEFRAILRIRRTEFIWAVTALAGVALLGTLRGILVAIVVSLIALVWQASNPPVHALGRKPGTNFFRPLAPEHPEDEIFPGLLLLRVEGRVFFANAVRVGEKIRRLIEETQPRVIALDFSGIFDMEYTALKALTEAERRFRERGVQVWLVGLNPEVLALIRRAPLGETLGRERLIINRETAVAKYLAAHPEAHPISAPSLVGAASEQGGDHEQGR